MTPLVLDIDGAVGALPDAQRFALAHWQEALRFGCGLRTFGRFTAWLRAALPPPGAHGPVLFGSGDFHHLSWPLIERCARALGQRLRVVVLDNHPDNMRFPFGVHCGSWVRRVALLDCVSHVDVLGITSSDIGPWHAVENYWRPLASGKLTYWSVGVDVRWARASGLGRGFRSFDSVGALVDAACDAWRADTQPIYLSIDKDVFTPSLVETNWDQGRMELAHAEALIEALRGRIVGADITGEVSSWRYATAWKRWLSAGDGQDTAITPEALGRMQGPQHALNALLVERMRAAWRTSRQA